jgi:thiol-disulfide isomerase/thioredoxin
MSSAATAREDGAAFTEPTVTPVTDTAESVSASNTQWRAFAPAREGDASTDQEGCRADGHAMACTVKSDDTDGTGDAYADALASDFVIELYQGEAIFDRSSLRFSEILAQGKPVVLVFWAGGCPVCRREMPEVETVSAQFEDTVIVVGVDVGPYTGLGEKSDGLALIEDQGLTFPMGTTPDASVLRDYRITGVPTMLFFTPTGEVIDRFTGAMGSDAMVRAVEDLLAASR